MANIFDKSLLIRTIVAIIAMPLILIIFMAGGYIILGFALFVAGVAAAELSRLSQHMELESYWWFQMLYAMGTIAGYTIWGAKVYVGMLVLYIILRTFLALHSNDFKVTVFSWSIDVAGIIWITLGWTHLLALRYFGLNIHMVPDDLSTGWFSVGTRLVFLVIFLIWIADTTAYLGGRAFGKHQLHERASPGKTWEGVIIGTVSSILAALLLGFLLVNEEFDPLSMVGLGILVAVLGYTGDLLESMFKRAAGAKNSSEILPGHGGLLDRFDSFTMVMPGAYYYILFLSFI